MTPTCDTPQPTGSPVWESQTIEIAEISEKECRILVLKRNNGHIEESRKQGLKSRESIKVLPITVFKMNGMVSKIGGEYMQGQCSTESETLKENQT